MWQRLLRKIAKPRVEEAPAYVDDQIQNFLWKMKKNEYPLHTPYTGKIYQPDKRTAAKNDGYKWRVAVYEVLQLNEDIKKLMLNNAPTLDIMKLVDEQWFLTMKDNAFIKMLEGVTSMEEIERVLN